VAQSSHGIHGIFSSGDGENTVYVLDDTDNPEAIAVGGDDDGEVDEELLSVQPDTPGNIQGEALSIEEGFIGVVRVQGLYFGAAENVLGAAARLQHLSTGRITISVIAAQYPPGAMTHYKTIMTHIMALPGGYSLPSGLTFETACSILDQVFLATGTLAFSGTIHCEAILATMIASGEIPVCVLRDCYLYLLT
jgi:hypothetical protein